MKKTIKDYDIKNKKVIIRVDFNVPMVDNKIVDDNRIIQSLPTIQYAIKNKAKVILMSHLGRIKNETDKAGHSLSIVANRLQELLQQKVIFINATKGKELEQAIDNLNDGDVLLMENTRFEDAIGNKESGNDKELGKYWASLGDIFINDAFATSHRAHASNVGIASNMEKTGIGFLIEKELDNIENMIQHPTHPFTVILGGSKVSDKIGVLEYILPQCDFMLIGGAMAFTFLASLGYNVGNSIVDKEKLDYCKDLLNRFSNKIILPVDVVVSHDINNGHKKSVDITDISNEEIGLDIGNKTVKSWSAIISSSENIIWNGPLGYVENKMYIDGTRDICQLLSQSKAKVIIGGGDTGAIVKQLGYDQTFYISTGGGATLEMLEGKTLPGIDIVRDGIIYEK